MKSVLLLENRTSRKIYTHHSRSTLKEMVIAASFILPYIETGLMGKFFNYKTEQVHWRTILSLLWFLLVIVSVLNLRKNKRTYKYKKALWLPLSLLTIYLLLNMLVSSFFVDPLSAFTQFCMIIVPFHLVYQVSNYIISRKLIVKALSKYALVIYACFLIFTIFFNFISYGMTLSLVSLSSFRLSASAGGVVTLGYTITMMYAFLIFNKDQFSFPLFVILCFIFGVSIIFNQSRGAIVLFLLLTAFALFSIKNKIIKYLTIAISLTLAIVIGNDMLVSIFPRLENLTAEGRFNTIVNCLLIFFSNVQHIGGGYGLNHFFPYQHWQSTTTGNDVFTNRYFNTFLYGDMRILIQPHNSAIYMLMETGIIGLSLLLHYFYRLYKIYPLSVDGKIVFLTFVILSMLESTIIIEPGISYVWLLILSLCVLQHQDDYERR